MEYSKLGNSSLHISQIGFGCMSLGNEDAENARLLHQAVDAGINFYDTADLYQQGNNEKTVGKGLKDKRSNVIISTKVGNKWRPDGSGWDWVPGKDYILSAARDSIRRLNTDYIDLYLLHGGTIQDPIEEILEAFELLKAQGMIRHYGISSIRPNVIREYIRRGGISAVMMQYSLLDRRPEESCLPLLKDNGIGVLARGSLAKGLLINKPPESFLNYDSDSVRVAAQAIRKLSNSNRTTTSVALQYVWQKPAINSAIVGFRTLEQLQLAIDAFDQPKLTTAELNSLDQVIPVNYYTDHR